MFPFFYRRLGSSVDGGTPGCSRMKQGKKIPITGGGTGMSKSPGARFVDLGAEIIVRTERGNPQGNGCRVAKIRS
jgi:hypothetical protein